ncbi:MAG: hypothetical protein GX033_02395 [Firmicutes bacterium]|nr:hypothetical protein [Bacillota bacterium]
MADNLFDCQPTLANYERAEILKHFSLVAQITGGQLHPHALRLSKENQVLISNLRWHQFPGEVVLQRCWAILVSMHIFLPTAIPGQIRLSNVYGEHSGIPLSGPPRLEANWSPADLMELYPPATYQILTTTSEPYSLLLAGHQLCFSTYRFYPSSFYLRAGSFLAHLAERVLAINPQSLQLGRMQAIELPWM